MGTPGGTARLCFPQLRTLTFSFKKRNIQLFSTVIPQHRTQCRTNISLRSPPAIYSSTRKHYAAVTKDTSKSEIKQKGEGEEGVESGNAAAQSKDKQHRTPWHREGSDAPPVRRLRSAGAMTKGKLLTTPSKLLKLILPLTTIDENSDRKDIEPLALLVHAQQPLSYLERLIQSEIPILKTSEGKEKIPTVHFLAEDIAQDSLQPKKPKSDSEGDMDETRIDGEVTRTGKINKDGDKSPQTSQASETLGESGVESYSDRAHEQKSNDQNDRKFVRWSSSTDIGDFIRDAAMGKEFEVEIEGNENKIIVAVPSFADRTYFLRTRLRKASRTISDLAAIKHECDVAAHKGAQRVAFGGFAALVAWWYTVYRLTFETDLGWDTMEPVTYLVGLSTLIASYLWFLWHNREISYRSALNLTISRRQSKLYAARGFDMRKWEALVEDGNALRKEIKLVANEYDVEWDESSEVQDDKATEALKEERQKQKEGKKEKKDDDKGDD
ncbi:MAG: hypothetical protein M1814_004596 [Vezdaea aestivalis]|nr:MAG: hypothetical protein M1814_004596 [Vezdaea aestivalis]